MSFYFCGRYIHIEGDPKQVENDMYDDVSIFWVFMTFMVTKPGKAILKLSSFTLFYLSKSVVIPE